MAQILMCKNKQVYNIDSHDVLNKALLPGSMQKNPCNDTYRLWIKERYNSGSNTLARLLQGKAFGQGNRPKIDANTFALSLSDCYWIKNDDFEIAFEDVSPYYNDFWTGSGEYTSGSIPTLYVPGAMSKEWLDKEHLKKDGDASALNRELSAIEFCKKCNVPVNDAFFQDNSLIVLNFTNPSIMLEQANMSGRIDSYDFTVADIINEFGVFGAQMLTIDAIVGNGDRHAGNFGFLRNPDTGEYTGFAPLYDFDHAFDATGTDKPDVLIKELKNIPAEFQSEIYRICDIGLSCDNEIIYKRARIVKEYV